MDDNFGLGYAMGQNDNGGGNSGMWGGDGSWIFAFLIIALIFGGQWGFGGGFGGNAGGQGGADTRAAVYDGFALNNLDNGVRGIQQGMCDGFYAMNTTMLQGFNGTNTAMMQGFNGVQSQLCNMAAQNQACCCETQRLIERGFADTNYNMSTQACETRQTIQNATRDIIDNQNAGTRAILDYLTQNELATLRNENQTLRFAASQSNQNSVLMAAMDANKAEILRRTGSECPIPAYVVPNPNCCYGNPLGVSYVYGQGGCGGYNQGCMGCAA